MIQLGLNRIARLVSQSRFPWKAIHVAGTNGKGSVCNYAYSMVRESGVRCGMFTSPHLIDRWDCISIDGQPISESFFREIEDNVRERDRNLNLHCSEFELLTATAFQAFSRSKVQLAVVEVGVGGSLDATNIIKEPAATVITKIGLDHQDLLGKSLEEIAVQKAGIIKSGSPCFIDGTNPPDVCQIIVEKARSSGATPIEVVNCNDASCSHLFNNIPSWDEWSVHKKMHMLLAFEASRQALQDLNIKAEWKQIIQIASKSIMPGRQQEISISQLTGRKADILLDGAHNAQSASALGEYVQRQYRASHQRRSIPVTWILAMSRGKKYQDILPLMIKPGDSLITVEFGPVDGMPWVSPMPAEELREAASNVNLQHLRSVSSVPEALYTATSIAQEGPLVVAGSLYLVSDILRLLRSLAK
jgi:dihydrofolate synthase